MRAFNCVVGIDKLCKARYKFLLEENERLGISWCHQYWW